MPIFQKQIEAISFTLTDDQKQLMDKGEELSFGGFSKVKRENVVEIIKEEDGSEKKSEGVYFGVATINGNSEKIYEGDYYSVEDGKITGYQRKEAFEAAHKEA